MCGPCASNQHSSFNAQVLHHCKTHDTHRVLHSTLTREALRRFHPSSYKIMDGHHTSLGASTEHQDPHKDFIYSCSITPLSVLFSPAFPLSANAHTLTVDDKAAYRMPLYHSPLLFFCSRLVGLCHFNPPLPVL